MPGGCPRLTCIMQVSRQNDVTVVELGPRYESLDEAAVEEMRERLLAEASGADPPRVVVDLSKTDFIGSMFIELLVRAWKRLTERGGTLALCGLQPFCTEVMQATRLDTLWKTYPTREEAITGIQQQEDH